MAFERITLEPDVMGGAPCIRGLRIPVATVVLMVADGMIPAEILAELTSNPMIFRRPFAMPLKQSGNGSCRYARPHEAAA